MDTCLNRRDWSTISPNRNAAVRHIDEIDCGPGSRSAHARVSLSLIPPSSAPSEWLSERATASEPNELPTFPATKRARATVGELIVQKGNRDATPDRPAIEENVGLARRRIGNELDGGRNSANPAVI